MEGKFKLQEQQVWPMPVNECMRGEQGTKFLEH